MGKTDLVFSAETKTSRILIQLTLPLLNTGPFIPVLIHKWAQRLIAIHDHGDMIPFIPIHFSIQLWSRTEDIVREPMCKKVHSVLI